MQRGSRCISDASHSIYSLMIGSIDIGVGVEEDRWRTKVTPMKLSLVLTTTMSTDLFPSWDPGTGLCECDSARLTITRLRKN